MSTGDEGSSTPRTDDTVAVDDAIKSLIQRATPHQTVPGVVTESMSAGEGSSPPHVKDPVDVDKHEVNDPSPAMGSPAPAAIPSETAPGVENEPMDPEDLARSRSETPTNVPHSDSAPPPHAGLGELSAPSSHPTDVPHLTDEAHPKPPSVASHSSTDSELPVDSIYFKRPHVQRANPRRRKLSSLSHRMQQTLRMARRWKPPELNQKRAKNFILFKYRGQATAEIAEHIFEFAYGRCTPMKTPFDLNRDAVRALDRHKHKNWRLLLACTYGNAYRSGMVAWQLREIAHGVLKLVGTWLKDMMDEGVLQHELEP